jgi:Cysteine-rich secretory protein family
MRYLLALSGLLLLTPLALAATPADDAIDSDVQVEAWTDTTPKSRLTTQFKTDMLDEHNGARRKYGVPALNWSDDLAADAQAYAQTLAKTRRFEHADRPSGKPVQGENLWMGTRTAYAFRDMAESWLEEVEDFQSGAFPNVSRTGSWHDVGHFTQMIWGETRAVGCAIAANADNEILVCRYFPAGNVWDENPLTP